MPIYDKLIRDGIPEIIEKSGKSFSTSILNNLDYIKELRKKSFEELQEYMDATSDGDALEELADLLEIIYALSECHGGDFNKVEEIRKQKADKKGRFQKKIFLIAVDD
ncbi:nucleoside triphosphate pyrophosphohydrolase [Robertmurraya kyonggiensis]|uniref:Phosphoribosyl-ATP pyrophosphohydrolase n=1 Tax=Robertmurraya kyonggiensis TaxID=1037680 RepID=A0A4U1D9A9_9BACI|nr:nucleoside triphosphate pyrophosphohydrolase [Robertmurraya kyonggiensis]TKC19129.1 phosphoribosyl-ATP pyrophosphohydrolase [Robertmurraya kyonggiensis]